MLLGTPVPLQSKLGETWGLIENVGTFDLQSLRKNRCDAAKKQARKARLAEDPDGDSENGQPQIPRSGQVC
jgi:hypothetical protein